MLSFFLLRVWASGNRTIHESTAALTTQMDMVTKCLLFCIFTFPSKSGSFSVTMGKTLGLKVALVGSR